MSEHILYLSFCVWVTSLNMMLSRFMHLPANFKMSLFFLCSTPLCKCSTSSLSLLWPRDKIIEGHLDYFQVLAITNNTAMNIVEHMSLWYD